MGPAFTFFLGTHKPGWLTRTTATLFVSARRLREYRRLPPVSASFAVDSGAFSQIKRDGWWGRWHDGQYVGEVYRWRDQSGGKLLWAAQQDAMCEPDMLARTGKSVREHQRYSIANYYSLRLLGPDLSWIPVLQGWTTDDYLRHVEDYQRAGNLALLPLVGVGSVCRRKSEEEVREILAAITAAVPGIRLHGFGLKLSALPVCLPYLASADSMSWSDDARRDASRVRRGLARRRPCPVGRHDAHRSGCANCLDYALSWRERVVSATLRPVQRSLFGRAS